MKLLHILNAPDYIAEITTLAARAQAGDRIAVASMGFMPSNPAIHQLMTALIGAAQRGARVLLVVDAYAFMVDHNDRVTGPLRHGADFTATKQPEFKQKLTSLGDLAVAGGTYGIINQPTSRWQLAQAGRSHIKTFIINDRLYVGGCNLAEPDYIDRMVGIEQADAARWLYDILEHTIQTGSVRQALQDADQHFKLDSQTTLLLDAGKPKQSGILQTALEVIGHARDHILLTCQFFPNSTTGKRLAEAYRRGVQVEVRYNHPSKLKGVFWIANHLGLAWERLRLPRPLFRHALPRKAPFLHAKVLCSEHAAIVGSHNFVTPGVRLGTAELALYSTDPAFSKKLASLLQAELQQL